MKNERGIRVPEKLRDKIKRAALAKKMGMAEYLDSVVPEIHFVELK